MKRLRQFALPTRMNSIDSLSVANPQSVLPAFADAGFNAVFDSSAEALVVIDQQGSIQRANARARKFLGWKESDASRSDRKDFLEDFPGFALTQLHTSEEMRRCDSAHKVTLPNGLLIKITLRAALPNTQNFLLCLEEDPSLERTDGKRRQAEAELATVLDSVQGGIILFDPAGSLRFLNAKFAQYFSLDLLRLQRMDGFEELENLVAQRFHDPETFSAPWKAFLAGKGEPRYDELEITRPAHRVLERFSRPVLDTRGRAVGWLELYNDVTGERRIQSKLLQTEKMAAVGQLVSGIAHELNNPLTTIMGYGQLLLGHGLAPAQLSEARKVFHEAERARRIVKNLLYFSRENKPERTRVDLNEIVERTLALRSYELKIENIVVECDLTSHLPETMADPYQLQQVVLNLLINAEQALLGDRGQGHVWIRTQRISGDRISLEVSDDGPGISPEVGSRIFDPFFTTKPPGVGTGLGLSIIYGIVQQHGGEVTFENQPGAGAKFTVELPLIPIPARSDQPLLSSPERKPQDKRTGHILVVEDEPSIAQLITDVLREEGHHVEAVLDSQQGLTKISRNWYDLVICDLRMPRLDGAAFYNALVRTGSPQQNRILFITGDILAPRTLSFLEKNGLPYLAKPFLVEELKLAVHCRLERNRQATKKEHLTSSTKDRSGSSELHDV